ncbi:peptidyl-prolyl cis-trans isomerase [Candidatus Sumerlaeota bacterium]|nr:peptidyl-prolyl cis-trans isomerase [Candidatus Sumerlaeota bacterium]
MKTHVALWAAIFVACVGLVPAAPTAPLLKYADYRGSEEVLVTAPGITITEGDLFRYMVLTGAGDVRDAMGWKRLSEPQKIVMQLVLDLMLYTELVAPRYQQPANAEDVNLEIKGEEITMFPAYRFLWGASVASGKMHIFPEDIAYHFKENSGLYSKPETAQVRRLLVPMPSPLSIEARNAALARAQTLRTRATLEGGLAPLLLEDPSLLVDPPGQTVSLNRDMAGVDPQILDEAFSLGVSQISRPIQTPAGFILLEVMNKTIAEPVDINAVSGEIKTALAKLQLGQQYDYQMLKAYMDAYPVDRARLYEFMSEDTELLSVNDFSLTVGEFNKLYADIVGNPDAPNIIGIGGQTYETITGELARRDLAKRGLLNDPFLVKSSELAHKVFRMNQYGRIRRAEVNPTPEELKEYIASKPSELDPGLLKTVWAMKLSPRQRENYNQLQLDELQLRMQTYMITVVQEARTRLNATLQDLKADETLDPVTALRGMTPPSDPAVRLRYDAMGEFSKFDTQAVLGVKYETLVLNEFTSPVPLRDGSVVSYFVIAEKPVGKLPKEQLLAAARATYINTKAFEEVLNTVKQWKKENKVVYAEPLRTGEAYGKAASPDQQTTGTLRSTRPDPALVQ